MMLEHCARWNRLRHLHPAAKMVFCLSGLAAAFLAATPRVAATVGLLVTLVTILGAGIRPRIYLRAATIPLSFLAVSFVTLAGSLSFTAAFPFVQAGWNPAAVPDALLVTARSAASFAALLFVSMTTPLPDMIMVLRRLHVPELLLDLMTLCYRTLFVFAETAEEIRTAQASRLGYAGFPASIRSLGSLVANMTVQVWRRSHELHLAAAARGNDGALVFLEPEYPHAALSVAAAAMAGSTLMLLALLMP